jgi:hypothetical protein
MIEDGIDKVAMEAFECSQCKNEARNMIFKPCNECYLCEGCYERKADKFRCDRCQGQITGVMKVFVTQNN